MMILKKEGVPTKWFVSKRQLILDYWPEVYLYTLPICKLLVIIDYQTGYQPKA